MYYVIYALAVLGIVGLLFVILMFTMAFFFEIKLTIGKNKDKKKNGET